MMTTCLSGFEDYDYDDSILARVIAESQQEYLANLKKNAAATNASSTSSSSSASTTDTPATLTMVDSPDIGKGKSIMPKDGRH